MPRAGWCDQDNAWVWVNDDGSCVNGHGPEHVSRVYDTDMQSAPPPAQPANVYPPPAGQPGSVRGGAYPAQPPRQPVYGGQYPQGERSSRGIVSLVLGILALLTSCFWPLGLALGLAGLVVGILGLKTDKRTLAIIGIVLSVLALLSALVFAIVGAAIISNPEFMREFEQELNRSIQ